MQLTRKKRAHDPIRCVECDIEFIPDHGNGLICSKGCRIAREDNREKNYIASGYRKTLRIKNVAANPIKYKTLHYKSRYGITFADAEAMLLQQGRKCAICRKRLEFCSEDAEARAHIDHCHNNGNVRGILCRPCNTMLGLGRDDTEVFKGAIRYLCRGGLE